MLHRFKEYGDVEREGFNKLDQFPVFVRQDQLQYFQRVKAVLDIIDARVKSIHGDLLADIFLKNNLRQCSHFQSLACPHIRNR